MDLFVDTLIKKVKRKDYYVSGFVPESLWLYAALI